ncbi:hypothetical protein KAI31_02580 [Candidatus Bathyarchaeota archaeon]|nr:hypothetical protein [Candidatus Bathyarchaeota archaeon]
MPKTSREQSLATQTPLRDTTTKQTKSMLIIGCGAAGITERQLKEAVETTMSYVKQVSNGEIGIIKVFSPTPK